MPEGLNHIDDKQNSCHFTDYIFIYIILYEYENFCIFIQI